MKVLCDFADERNIEQGVRALSTRAFENMVAVAMANPNGDKAGCSCAFSPICWEINGKCVDNTVLLADDKTEGILYAEFDMEADIRTHHIHIVKRTELSERIIFISGIILMSMKMWYCSMKI